MKIWLTSLMLVLVLVGCEDDPVEPTPEPQVPVITDPGTVDDGTIAIPSMQHSVGGCRLKERIAYESGPQNGPSDPETKFEYYYDSQDRYDYVKVSTYQDSVVSAIETINYSYTDHSITMHGYLWLRTYELNNDGVCTLSYKVSAPSDTSELVTYTYTGDELVSYTADGLTFDYAYSSGMLLAEPQNNNGTVVSSDVWSAHDQINSFGWRMPNEVMGSEPWLGTIYKFLPDSIYSVEHGGNKVFMFEVDSLNQLNGCSVLMPDLDPGAGNDRYVYAHQTYVWECP